MWYSSEKATNELGYSARPVEHGFRDALAWMRDQAERQTDYKYDPAGRLEEVIQHLEDDDLTTKFIYDPWGTYIELNERAIPR